MTTLAAHTEQPVLHSEVVENPDPETDSESDSEAGDDEYELDDEIIERATFEQLLQMDDDEDRNFSRSLVDDYFTQAEQTFEELDTAMSRLDFADMARLGHFLKGSSAALGLVRIKGSCERLQHYGELKDAEGVASIPKEEAEDLIQALLAQMRDEYDEAKEHLDAFYITHQSQGQNPDQD